MMGQRPRELSVSEVTRALRSLIEPEFQSLLIRGEISNLKWAPSGHLYLSLKDSESMIGAAFFGANRRPELKRMMSLGLLGDGVEVICHGRISVYPPRGSYQLVIDQLELVGVGELQKAFELLKEKLETEGLFAQERKKPLPLRPRRLAVVTSPTGAVLQDILQILGRRAPHLEVTVIPVRVQGEGSVEEIVSGLRAADQFDLGDVIVLARGGGSLEDLWSFNDERVARAIASLTHPIVSAVGHEVDFSISDFVSDLRAPTPSAAAEILSNGWVAIQSDLDRMELELKRRVLQRITHEGYRLQSIAQRLKSPGDLLRERGQRLDEILIRMTSLMKFGLERRWAKLNQSMGKLDALSPLRVLDRGFALVTDGPTGNLIVEAQAIQPLQKMKLRFRDGVRDVQAMDS